ncbi:MAG TPA: outer membrane beta-barrel protein, partial [bacterium]|nr:outer membrane beta-barrel protein [bacterium]
MKKILVIALALGLAFFAANVNAQEKYVGGGFEMSGSIVTGMGYQYHNDKANTEIATDVDGVLTGPGPMGKYMGADPSKKHYFGFFLDGVELDIMKSFGENVRLRADLDFGRMNSSGAGTQAFVLEQAYATANIPAGNGVEFLVGRFNAPIGFESVDVADNDLISQTILIRSQIRPVGLTGAKIYYAFSDLVDLHFWAAN